MGTFIPPAEYANAFLLENGWDITIQFVGQKIEFTMSGDLGSENIASFLERNYGLSRRHVSHDYVDMVSYHD